VSDLVEGAEADIAICAEKGHGVLIEKGVVRQRLKEEELVPRLLEEIRRRQVPSLANGD
jgi:hypothetical protein